MRRNLIVWLTFLGGVFYFWEYFFPEESGLSYYVGDVGRAVQIMGALAVGLGTINLLRAHINRISRRRPGYHNSVALILGLFIMAFTQIWIFYHTRYSGDPSSSRVVIEKVNRVLFVSIYQGMSATIFSLLAFFMASASYRAFRIKSLEAGIMMGVAIIVMLGQIPVGTEYITGFLTDDPSSIFHYLKVDVLRNWIMDVWNSAAQRGILFGVYVGSLAMTLRIWLSLERGAFFEEM